jgi:hypothetical protein
MAKHKVDELEDALLDAAVALAEGRLLTCDEPRWPKGEYKRLRKEFGGRHVVRWYAREGEDADGPETAEVGGWEPIDNWGSPSTDWEHGGPIIERERIDISAPEEWSDDERWYAGMYQGKDAQHSHMKHEARGPTPLIAAMRAYVASKFGEEVELP